MVYTMLILVSIMVISLALLRLIIPKVKIVREVGNSVVAVYAADTGMEWCLFSNRNNPSSIAVPAKPISLVTVPGVTIQYYQNSNPTNCPFDAVINFRTVGNYRGISRSFEVQSSVSGPIPTPTPTPTPIPPGILDRQVATGSDDAEENTTTGAVLLSSRLELIYNSVVQIVGIRFTNITVPAGATITNAYIQFTTDAVDSTAVSLTIQGQNSDNPIGFTTAVNNISSRPRTVSSISWPNIPNWTVVGEAGVNQRTANIASIIQEIINRPGWTSGNAIVTIISGSVTNVRRAESFNSLSTSAPILHIEYTVP